MPRGSDVPGRRALKREVRALLDATGFETSLERLEEMPRRRTLRALFSFLCDPDERRKRRAAEAVGLLGARVADERMEEGRELVRRLMWSLNDESGSCGWGAPEALGEIMTFHEGLAREYVHILVSYLRKDGNPVENPLLQRGLLAGIGRLAAERASLLQARGAGPHLLPFLDSPDPVVRGLAAWCVGRLAVREARGRLPRLLEDEAEVLLYQNHDLFRCRTKDLAREALERIGAGTGGD